MRAPALARAALIVLALSALSVGLPAALAPHAFYNDFPLLAHCAHRIPPFIPQDTVNTPATSAASTSASP